MNILFRIKRRLRWEWHKLNDRIYRQLAPQPFIMTYEDTVNYILANRASIARFGDGELNIIYGKTLGFQSMNVDLAAKLRTVLRSNVNGLLVCLPDVFSNLERYNQVEQNFWRSHLYFNRKRWLKNVVLSRSYGTTFISRFYSMEYDKLLAASRISMVRKLWEGRDVIFVEGKDTKMGVGNDLFDNAGSIRRVLCPSTNAFSVYKEIVYNVLNLKHGVNDLFILALGPTATLLAADLCKEGLQALDLGHIDIEYGWYCMGVTKKVPITGKFSNEATLLGYAEDAVVGAINDDKYERQIILDLSSNGFNNNTNI